MNKIKELFNEDFMRGFIETLIQTCDYSYYGLGMALAFLHNIGDIKYDTK